jgi:hypothetical protein
MVSDNNLSAAPREHLFAVIDFLKEHDKRVTFDNGFDCKHIDSELAQRLAGLRFARQGMRLAFDRIEEDGVFQYSVRCLTEAGVSPSNIMVYTLFNFTDTPREADYRMRESVNLKVSPYPQCYEPLGELNRDAKFVGKHWTKALLKCFRRYWLMRGYHNKFTFAEYVERADVQAEFQLGEEDMAAWGRS